MRHRVFVSHSHKDGDIAMDVCRRLERQGITCWIAPRDIAVGEDYSVRVAEAIDACAVFAIILSGHSNVSRFVKAETEQAFNSKIPIFPLRVEDVTIERGLRFFISITHWVDAFGPHRAAGIERFVAAVAARALKGRSEGGRRGGADWAALARAVGPGARDYVRQWKRMDERRQRVAWSWEAALGGPLWPFYRGMTMLGAMMVGIVALLIAVGAGAVGAMEGALLGLVAGWLLTAAIGGLVGSAALRRHVEDGLAHARAPRPGMRPLWMSGAAALLVGTLALSAHAGSGESPTASASPAAPEEPGLSVALPAGSGLRIGQPDPIADEARRQAELEEARASGASDAMNLIAEAQLTPPVDPAPLDAAAPLSAAIPADVPDPAITPAPADSAP